MSLIAGERIRTGEAVYLNPKDGMLYTGRRDGNAFTSPQNYNKGDTVDLDYFRMRFAMRCIRRSAKR